MDYSNLVKQNDVWDEQAERLHHLQKMRLFYSKLYSKAIDELIHLSGEQNCIGKEFIFRSHDRVGAVDYKNIEQLQYVDLDKYRKEDITIWKLEYMGEQFIEKMES